MRAFKAILGDQFRNDSLLYIVQCPGRQSPVLDPLFLKILSWYSIISGKFITYKAQYIMWACLRHSTQSDPGEGNIWCWRIYDVEQHNICILIKLGSPLLMSQSLNRKYQNHFIQRSSASKLSFYKSSKWKGQGMAGGQRPQWGGKARQWFWGAYRPSPATQCTATQQPGSSQNLLFSRLSQSSTILVGGGAPSSKGQSCRVMNRSEWGSRHWDYPLDAHVCLLCPRCE